MQSSFQESSSPPAENTVAAIEPLAGSSNYTIWKRRMISYLKEKQVWDIVSGETEEPRSLFKHAKPTMDDVVGWTGGSRFQAVPILEIQVKAYEHFQEWSQGEAFAYRTIHNRLTLRVKDQMAERGSSRELWNQLKERYDRGELAAYCEIFAQLKETTGDNCTTALEFVTRIGMLVDRLNAIAPRSIGDTAHTAILLTQIGSHHAFIAQTLQNEKISSPVIAGIRIVNADWMESPFISGAVSTRSASPSQSNTTELAEETHAIAAENEI